MSERWQGPERRGDHRQKLDVHLSLSDDIKGLLDHVAQHLMKLDATVTEQGKKIDFLAAGGITQKILDDWAAKIKEGNDEIAKRLAKP